MSSSPPRIHYTKIPTRMYDPNYLNSYVVGRRKAITADAGSQRDVFTLTFSGSLAKMAIHMSSYNDGDYWNLSGSDWTLFDTIYTKSVPESFVLDVGKTLLSGSQIILDFFNTGSNAKTVWVDYYFIK